MSSNPCVVAKERFDADGDDRWMSIHKKFISETSNKDAEILLIGDDIFEGLMFTEVYRTLEEMHLLNFSIRGDKIENLLWRITNGELEVKPKIVVLHCGTNNIPVNESEEIAEGIIECINQIRKNFDGFIVVLTLLPRGAKPNLLREKIDKVNKLIQEKCQGFPKVQIIDISSGLLQADGSISHHDLYDYLNLTNAASKKVFEPVWELLSSLLNENEKELLPLTPSE